MILKKITFFLLFFHISLVCSFATSSMQKVNMDLFSLSSTSQNPLSIQQTISCRSELSSRSIALNTAAYMYGASLDADISLFNDASMVRVILVDKNSVEYLIFEVYSLLEDNRSFSVKNVCQETKALNGVHADSLRIELLDAEIDVHTVHSLSKPQVSCDRMNEYRNSIHTDQESAMIELLNSQIKKKGMSWRAGKTSLSSLTYAEKKRQFPSKDNDLLVNLQGFEYYAGGIFDHKSSIEPETITQEISITRPMIDSFDWRTRHGATDPKSPYYDATGVGWDTPIKEQGKCGSCWAHSTCGTIEMAANLYYNRHLNMDLAEQHLMDCSDANFTAGDGCGGGLEDKALLWASKNGCMEEAAFPYKASKDPTCADSSKTPKENLRFAGIEFDPKPPSEDSLKRFLIFKGPLSVAIPSMAHVMVLIGFRKTNGNTVWIYKNSLGPNNGEKGYAIVNKKTTDFKACAMKLPLSSRIYTKDSIRCADFDKDGYYNWGIGPKPDNCPSNSKNEPDCDDFNAGLGPMDQITGACKPIQTGVLLHSLEKSNILYNCIQNPIQRVMIIHFITPHTSKLTVAIFNLKGNQIANLPVLQNQDNRYQVTWNFTNPCGVNVGQGTYICKIDQVQKGTNLKTTNSFKFTLSE